MYHKSSKRFQDSLDLIKETLKTTEDFDLQSSPEIRSSENVKVHCQLFTSLTSRGPLEMENSSNILNVEVRNLGE